MDILFAYMKVSSIVNGTEKKPNPGSPPPDILAWEEKNDYARMLIMQAVTSTVMEDLISCTTGAEMWTKLRSIHQLKSAENIYMVHAQFYDYKMSKTDSIKTHINNIKHKASILKDLGEPQTDTQIITKILMSLPPGYNSTVAAWANVPPGEQTVPAITTRLLQHEHILKQQDKENFSDTAYFTRAQPVTKKLSQLDKREKDAAYLKELQSRTVCYNCGEPDHWSRDCTKPPRDHRHHQRSSSRHDHRYHRRNTSSHDKFHDKGKRPLRESNACVAKTVSSENDDTLSQSSVSEGSSCDEYAFTTISHHSEALSVSGDSDIWFGDTGATEHMTDKRSWFSTYTSVPEGSWYVSVADNRRLPVLGTGTIRILRRINGLDREGSLEDVLYVPQLTRILFSIGIAIDKGLSFISSGSTCEFRL